MSLVLLSGCTKKTDNHMKRYAFEKTGKISEEVVFTLDETDTFITHILLTVVPTRELLEELAGNKNDDELNNVYNSQVYPLGNLGSKQEHDNENDYLKLQLKTGQASYIYQDIYIVDIDVSNSKKVSQNRDILNRLHLFPQYKNAENGLIAFKLESIKEDKASVLYPALSQGETK